MLKQKRATSSESVISGRRSVLYIRIVYVHTLCLPSFPSWCSAYSREIKVRHVPSSFCTKNMTPPSPFSLELCTTVIQCTVITVRRKSFIFFSSPFLRLTRCEDERETMQNEIYVHV